MQTEFIHLGLAPELLTAVKRQGYVKATTIQALVIPLVLAGKDLKAKARTGSGKTAAFGLALLQKFLSATPESQKQNAGNQIAMLIVVPTRELAQQIRDSIRQFAQDLGQRKPKVCCVFGGVNITPQMLNLRGGADILIATPGRLLDLAAHNAIRFESLQTLVLDEADRLLQLGFAQELSEIFKLLPKKRQSLLFSATFPQELDVFITALLYQPTLLDVHEHAPVEIVQRALQVVVERKNAVLVQLIRHYQDQQVLVFASAKNTCNRLVLKLAKAGIVAQALHGDKSQASRQQALRDFKEGKLNVLIATDLAARGLDIEQLPVVINFDLPRSPNDYVHRIGRTGRAGHAGEAISLISEAEESHFQVIEKRMKRRIIREDAVLLMT